MFDKIVYISDRCANVKLREDADITFNLMNLHVIFEDQEKKILGEVDDLDGDLVKIRFLGEIRDGKLIGGTLRKPTLDASCRVISQEEIPLVTGKNDNGYMLLGNSPFYNDREVFMDVNGFFSNHFAIFGNSGSGKSCGVTRIFQNMFEDQRLFPYKSNIIMFDSSAEYYNAFKDLSSINSNYSYRFISTNEIDPFAEKLRVPIYLLNEQDLALLLNVTSHSQLPIIERMLKLARIFSEEETDANQYKNHLIAKAIMTILYTNETAPNKRNEIFSIIASCSTPEFNLESVIQGVGYTRKFRECFLIDQFGNFTESVLMTEYLNKFIKEEYDDYEPKGNVFFDLNTLEKALNFTLISEGWLRNENTYGDGVTIKVRLHELIVGNNAKYFDYQSFVTLEQFVSSLLITNGKKYQFVNINLDDVDDVFAKVIVKIYSRLIFSFAKGLSNRASIPFHLIVEEAHRYIQNDTDTFLIGYNIFDRIAKEGRKYGVILGLITQRPVEMSDTVISQCSNFLIFKMNHPADVDYIRKMVPNISDEIVEKQKTLQSGTCLAFGQAFTIPLIVRLQMPNPAPKSGNCDVVSIWNGGSNKQTYQQPQNIPKIQSQNIGPQMVVQPPIQQTNNAPVMMEKTTDTVVSIPQVPSVPSQPVQQGQSFQFINQPDEVEKTEAKEDNKPLFMNLTKLAEEDDSKKDGMNEYNSVENYNANVDDGSLHPNETPQIPINSSIINIPKTQSLINTEVGLTPNIEMPQKQPDIIIPAGQNVTPNLMEGFGDNTVVEQ
ncbi:MAG: ATP-binding protein [Bacilli bacterium]|nr:ATP-binding protein [Bacilli bacterium]